jgi:hypothetical protein
LPEKLDSSGPVFIARLAVMGSPIFQPFLLYWKR